ncbi:MAG: hypothetical protein MUP22_03190 [Desulfobacterales bacterium]|nr:hypothetical protein [Desulfobacterales bacterium]
MTSQIMSMNHHPIAIIGMSGIFPGALNLDKFWDNIIKKVDTSSDVPKNRWILDPDLVFNPAYTPNKTISKRACFIQNDALESIEFKSGEIDIDPDLLKDLDPLHKIVLFAGKNAVSSITSTQSSSVLNKESTGVILAAIALPTDASSLITRKILGKSFERSLFAEAGHELIEDDDDLLTINQCLASRVTGFPAAIVSKALGLNGCSYTLDAACASSLYAVKLACDELISGRADTMLAGGVSRPDSLYTQVGFSQLRSLSPSGRCSPFDESADGLVVGEGAGFIVLKRMDDALRDGNKIFGLIRGIGVSNDMKGNLLAPDSEGQLRAMKSAYESSGLSPSDIDLIECHGTGTPLGDSTELKSMVQLWGDDPWNAEQCAIGSVKSMIGHLLTGAGIAGLIKTVLAMSNRIFPPSIHFKQPPKNSPLINSPFRVQTDPQAWEKRNTNTPRRAAINAFGFGGTNAHIILEEFISETSKQQNISHTISVISSKTISDERPSIAVIGMETAFGPIRSLRSFQETVFTGASCLRSLPGPRFKGCESIAEKYINIPDIQGGFMDGISLGMDEFRIPPKEIPDILPQQLLMLKTAAGAMKNAGISSNENRPRMSTFIGLDFDFETTNFHLQWDIENKITFWKKILGLDLDKEQTSQWLEYLKTVCGEPLTATRTLGALASIVASRISREFHFGGPSFVVSEAEASGLRALEIGVRSLQQNETDTVLAGAIDFAGDVRNTVISHLTKPLSKNGNVSPFDVAGDGTLPGDGCAAVILKRLDDAIHDGNRIYCTIKGIGASSGGDIQSKLVSKESYLLSLKRCLKDANVFPESITHMETHGSGYKEEDTIESEALVEFFSNQKDSDRKSSVQKSISLGSIKPNFGHTGAASGLASFVKSALCLYHHVIPPISNFSSPQNTQFHQSPFHMPKNPQYWLRDSESGSRMACVASVSSDGSCMHVILEETTKDLDSKNSDELTATIKIEKKSPVGLRQYGLFVVQGDSPSTLSDNLSHLQDFVKNEIKRTGHMELAAAAWYAKNPLDPNKKHAVSILLKDEHKLDAYVDTAKKAVLSGTPKKLTGPDTIGYSPDPLFNPQAMAFVFPGSGNHYLGMGRGIGIQWPEIFNAMDDETPHLKSQMLPEFYMPWRSSWEPGWEKEAYEKIISDPLHMIFGQVTHGRLISRVIQNFGVNPNAVIGYSLGESVGLFAMRAWPNPGHMLERMLSSQLFRTDLFGPCNALRKAWKVPADEQINWVVGMVNRPAEGVIKAVSQFPYARLLIVNSPEECVIGGHRDQIDKIVKTLGCDVFFLDGVVTVHCDAVIPVAKAYRDLHHFPTNAPEDIRFYSCAWGKHYETSTNLSAQSILDQAIEGFDFTKVIERAYRDGLRIFMEMGPFSSCTRMIGNILGSRPHLAISACNRGEEDDLSILKFLGSLITERVPVDLNHLYGPDSYPHDVLNKVEKSQDKQIFLKIGSKKPYPALPKSVQRIKTRPLPIQESSDADVSTKELIDNVKRNIELTTETHNTFLQMSAELNRSIEETISLQTRLIKIAKQSTDIPINYTPSFTEPINQKKVIADDPPAFSRELCMEFAIGSVAKVLGPEFEIVDTYKTRVRLPDEPLMLADRIVSIYGEKLSLGSGRIVTQHDVLPDAWYLNGGKAPVCISVEAGQADLFLCSYLGIDHMVKGRRCYRLLDASVIFHRGLPQPGDTITYDINIEKFIKQGETYLFFFNFTGTINDQPLISMSDGCAGFFTEDEVKNSGGIILTQEDTSPATGVNPSDWIDLVPMDVEMYDKRALSELRNGNISKCFGSLFEGIELSRSLRLPTGKMKLIDRVLHLDPKGGRYGMGVIKTEADINPDDWFLTCHFMDDMVMPGTLMYECCAHTLRVYLLRLGWVTEKPDVCFEPVMGKKAVLKCRGPVTPETKKVVYEVEIKELGYSPEPFAIADAHMYADGHRIVMFKDMSMKISGLDRKEIESFWKTRKTTQTKIKSSDQPDFSIPSPHPVFTFEQLLEFATGDPANAFGDKYTDFSKDRFIARLPNPPLLLIDRIPHIEPVPWVLKPDGWIQSEYDVSHDAWYFIANRIPVMPFSILLEIALQPCGWLAAYMGSALRSSNDLKFRNLGGTAVCLKEVLQRPCTLKTQARLTHVSEAAEMIIEQFDFRVLQDNEVVFKGNTNFGFFTNQSLSTQAGIRGIEKDIYIPTPEEIEKGVSHVFDDIQPLFPYDMNRLLHSDYYQMNMPSKALRMIDRIDLYVPDGGPNGLGYIRGIKEVDPSEWFFKAHFYQDPVCPGSLGIESFLQLLKFIAMDRWKDLRSTHTFDMILDSSFKWTYRGQILKTNKKIEVEAYIKEVQNMPSPSLIADGFLKVDGLYIYKMGDFGICLIPYEELKL